MNGFTVYVCVGRWAGFHILVDGPSLRIVLGWVAIAFCAFDIEVFLEEFAELLELGDGRTHDDLSEEIEV